MSMTEPAKTHDPGVVFWLPPYSGLPGDPTENGHPHALVIPAEPEQFCSLAYGSTKEAEHRAGAVHHPVKPRPIGRSPNGLTQLTYFYPGVLALREYGDLPERSGYLGSDLGGLRKALRRALGISQGCTGGAGHLAGSWRGRIVKLKASARAVLGTDLAVIVTAAKYSRAQAYQVVVPIYDGTGRAVVEPVVEVAEAPWLTRLGKEGSRALLFVPTTVSVWHRDHIAAESRSTVLDGEVMTALDRNLCKWFSLDPPR
jgi:hypothetical protein